MRVALEDHAQLYGMSGRGVHRACRVARTIADLAGSADVNEGQLTLALTLQQARSEQ